MMFTNEDRLVIVLTCLFVFLLTGILTSALVCYLRRRCHHQWRYKRTYCADVKKRTYQHSYECYKCKKKKQVKLKH